jgi:hypothetical protein
MARTNLGHVSPQVLIPGHLVSFHYHDHKFPRINTNSIVYNAASRNHLGHCHCNTVRPKFTIFRHRRGCQEKQTLGLRRLPKTEHVIVGFISPAFVERIDKSFRCHIFIIHPNHNRLSLPSRFPFPQPDPLLHSFPNNLDHEVLHRLRRFVGGYIDQCSCCQLLERRSSKLTNLRHTYTRQWHSRPRRSDQPYEAPSWTRDLSTNSTSAADRRMQSLPASSSVYPMMTLPQSLSEQSTLTRPSQPKSSSQSSTI